MNDSAPETTAYLVSNGGEYDDYRVLALYTDKVMAQEYAEAVGGVVEDWQANVPKEKWMYSSGNLRAYKKDGTWMVSVYAYNSPPFIEAKGASANLGHYSGWDEPDPKTGEYTSGYASSTGQSQEECEQMCLDAFTELVAKLDNRTPIEVIKKP